MEVSIFGIPLLTDEIAQYLYLQDLSRCVLVSKEWNASFTSRLWRNVDPKGTSAEALIRHQEHIRTINILEGVVFRHLPEFYPCNLQSLDYTSVHGMDDFMILQLVESSPYLQHLAFKTKNNESDLQGRLTNTLENHPGLKKLKLECCEFYGPMAVQRLIQACHRLYSLDINIWSLHRSYAWDVQEQLTLAKDAIYNMGNTQHRELSIVVPTKMETPILLPLIERSPSLDQLRILDIRYEDTLSKIAYILREKGRSRLRHLALVHDIPYMLNPIHEKWSEELAFAIGCSSNADHDGHFAEGKEGLQSLSLALRWSRHPTSAQALSQHLARSLTDACFGRFKTEIPIRVISNILHCLPNLRSLRVCILLSLDETDGLDINTTLPTTWNCLRLRKLDLSINRRILGTKHTNYKDYKDWVLGHIFSQVGRLTELEGWTVRHLLSVLEVESGYLGHLVGLKNLRELTLCEYCDQFSIDAARWMLEHWTRFGRLEVGEVFIPDWRPGSGRIRPHHPAIDQLQLGRPWIEIMMRCGDKLVRILGNH